MQCEIASEGNHGETICSLLHTALSQKPLKLIISGGPGGGQTKNFDNNYDLGEVSKGVFLRKMCMK